MNGVRLKKRAEFVSVSRNRKAVLMPHFTLQYLLKPEQKTPRFGFTVSKKVGNAVVRNRVKRRLREIVRLYIKQNNNLSLLPYDFVLIARTSVFDASFRVLLDHFQAALNELMLPSSNPL